MLDHAEVIAIGVGALALVAAVSVLGVLAGMGLIFNRRK